MQNIRKYEEDSLRFITYSPKLLPRWGHNWIGYYQKKNTHNTSRNLFHIIQDLQQTYAFAHPERSLMIDFHVDSSLRAVDMGAYHIIRLRFR